MDTFSYLMKQKINNIFIIILLSVIFFALFAKIYYVNNFVLKYTGENFHGALQAFFNDSVVISSVLILLTLSYYQKTHHILSVALRVISLLILLVYLIDTYVIVKFNTHLTLFDSLKYWSYSLKYLNQIYFGNNVVYQLITSFSLLVICVIGIYLVLSKHKISSNNYIKKLSYTSIFLLIISSYSFMQKDKYIHSWIYKNFIYYNFDIISEAKAYSKDFVSNFSRKENIVCSASIKQKPNIIMLMVESLSSYQSNYFSGIKNWTPNIDEIARNHSAYRRFYANGFTTEDGEISLLTGQLPIYKPGSYTNGGGTSFHGFFNLDSSLPNILKEFGYSTDFMSTADLEFSKTGNWAKSIGFNHVEGHDHPYYDTWPRFHFKSAPDEALFKRVLKRIEEHNNDKHFIFIKTLSSHHPYKNPETGNRSEEETFRYIDEQIGTFYKQLNEMEYFKDGMLIIVGDHRAMIPLKNEEINKYGELRAVAKIPLITILPFVSLSSDNNSYQQIDIYNSLVGLITGEQCHSDWIGNIFSGKQAKYIAHRRGDNRNIVSVFSGDRTSSVMLDGNDTKVISEYPETSAIRKELVSKINSLRMINTR